MREWPVHPHGRGKQSYLLAYDIDSRGSSPRSWETAEWFTKIRHKQRFIPTVVGNSADIRLTTPAYPVHPHGRGKQGCCSASMRRASGSSPRSWETVHQSGRQVPAIRFIPTVVGNRLRGLTGVPIPTVHPHGRGKQEAVETANSCERGSSPRSWETGILSHVAGR